MLLPFTFAFARLLVAGPLLSSFLTLSFLAALVLPLPVIGTGISSTFWRSPNITASRAERISAVQLALQPVLDAFNTTNQFSGQTYETFGNAFGQMAELDRLSNQTTYEALLEQLFARTVATRTNFQDTDLNFAITYGYAAMRAYAAYNSSSFLQYALQVWSFASALTISTGATSIIGKNVTIESACNGSSMGGGTFWTTTPSDPRVAAMSTGYFVILSALLAEATDNPTYLNAATESADFIQGQLYNSAGLVQQIMSASTNDSCQITDPTLNSFNSGLFIEGLAILASYTRDPSTQTLLDVLITAVLSSSQWLAVDGIITNGAAKHGDSILVRALATAYRRNATSSDIRQSVHDFIGVQYNALIDLASNGDGIYAAQWIGPASSQFSMSSQTNALDALLGAVDIDGSSDSTTSTVTTAPSSTLTGSSAPIQTSPTAAKKSPAAAIAGGIVGAVAFIGISIIVWLFLRRRSSKYPAQSQELPETSETPRPFTIYTDTTSSGAFPPVEHATTSWVGPYSGPYSYPFWKEHETAEHARTQASSSPLNSTSASGPSAAAGGQVVAPEAGTLHPKAAMAAERVRVTDSDEEPPPGYV